ncbi:hypothetical protein [Gryllotalpicola ginsengisoli]|uniref:hypothetical protein n=1 Tax=Gryllotalpicola ginsengisoli TaxID=444608 RepID=UPI0003B4F7A2|nr:hypothetical protein [Gryllotalpicola ginsengisoli]
MIPGAALLAASVSYLASVTLGVLVATRLVDSRGFHWLHHTLYVLTFVLAATAVATLGFAGYGLAAGLLGPALIPFAAIPFLGTRGVRHPIAGSLPAPFYLAAVFAFVLR